MKTFLTLICLTVSIYANSADISTVTCDSHMDMGFFSGNENGVFTYASNPLKISIMVGAKEVILTDSTHLCGIEGPRQYSTSTSGDATSGLDVVITSLVAQAGGESGDGGHISLGTSSGLFTCPYLPSMNPQIELSNCSINAIINDCTTNLFKLNDWSLVSGPIMTCLNANSDFSSGIAILCQADKLQLSKQFSQYLMYQKEYNDTLAWFQALPLSQRGAVARNKVQTAKENWETLGQKNETGIILSKVNRAYSTCNPI